MNYYNELPVFQLLAKHYVITERLSLGMSGWWRSICLKYARLKPGDKVLDLMCGDGRVWPQIRKYIGEKGKVVGLDYCQEMLLNLPEKDRHLAVCQPFQKNDFSDASMDSVVSMFGMKTLSTMEKKQLMGEINRVLKPGGHFALIELQMPKNIIMRSLVKLQIKFFGLIASVFCPDKKASLNHLNDYMVHFAKTNHTIFYSPTTITTQIRTAFGGLLLIVYGRKL